MQQEKCGAVLSRDVNSALCIMHCFMEEVVVLCRKQPPPQFTHKHQKELRNGCTSIVKHAYTLPMALPYVHTTTTKNIDVTVQVHNSHLVTLLDNKKLHDNLFAAVVPADRYACGEISAGWAPKHATTQALHAQLIKKASVEWKAKHLRPFVVIRVHGTLDRASLNNDTIRIIIGVNSHDKSRPSVAELCVWLGDCHAPTRRRQKRGADIDKDTDDDKDGKDNKNDKDDDDKDGKDNSDHGNNDDDGDGRNLRRSARIANKIKNGKCTFVKRFLLVMLCVLLSTCALGYDDDDASDTATTRPRSHPNLGSKGTTTIRPCAPHESNDTWTHWHRT